VSGPLTSFGGDTIGKLGLGKLQSSLQGKIGQRLAAEAQKRGQRYLVKQAQKAAVGLVSRAVGSKAASVLRTGASLYQDGNLDVNKIASQNVQALARRGAQEAARRGARMVAQETARRGARMVAQRVGVKSLPTRSLFSYI
jgi:hypothetical protein